MEPSPSHIPIQQQSIARSITSFTGARLFTVQSWEIDSWWPHVSHHVDRWIEFDDTWTAAGVKDELKAARAQLWCMHKDRILGIWITRICETDSCSVGAVWGCAGDFKEHMEDAIAFFGIIEDWFREMGCKVSEWTGRGGWERVFTDYKRHAVVLRKRL